MSADEFEFDTVIVGSGVAGALIADRIAATGRSVALIEAGPRLDRGDVFAATKASPEWDASAGYPDPPMARRAGGPHMSEMFDLTADGEAEVSYLRCVGGTTWHWSGCTPRLLPSDMATKSSFGFGVDWPVTYDELEAYYHRAERELGVSGDDAADYGTPRTAPFPLPPMPFTPLDRHIAAGLAPHGVKIQAMPQARGMTTYGDRPACHGHNFCTPVCPIGAQYTATIHVERAEGNGATVFPEHVVTRIRTSRDDSVHSVDARRPDGSERTFRGRTFVLAANGVESPRLLLASRNSRFPAGLANRSGNVGRYLMGHTEMHMTLRMAVPVHAGRGPLSLTISSNLRDGPFRSRHAGGLLVVDNNLVLREIATELLRDGLTGPSFERRLAEEASRRFRIILIAEERPHADNRIVLDWSRPDRAGLPKMRANISEDPYCRIAGDRLVEILRKIETEGRWRILGRRDLLLGTHLMGTLRMGKDPKNSVADSDGRTHDHRNLFVAGSALFPTSGTANPTLTIAALALRSADALLAQLKQ